MITLSKGAQQLSVESGELLSYKADGYEYIHQKGSPGWSHSDTEMFPVIGPTEQASYRVQVPRGNAIQDQHGLLRDMEYSLAGQGTDKLTFIKEYTAGTRIRNSKFPKRSRIEWLIWPFDFTIEKTFSLTDEGAQISFRLQGERDMPYMFGYHPAFKLRTAQARVEAGDRVVSLDEVLAAGSKALLLENAVEITLRDERPLTLHTKGFGHMMLWTEVPNMLCIEPITFYPYSVAQHNLHTGFDYLEDSAREFGVTLIPHYV